jgi:hypothetical protein
VFALLVLAALAAPCSSAQGFEYAARHRHLLRDCRGTLRITPDGISFEASRTADARAWTFEEIQTLAISSPTSISILTFEDQRRYIGKDRIFEFDLLEGKATPELSAFLLARVKRPLVLSVLPDEAGKPAFEIRAKHLGTITGAMGTLRIYADSVVFQSAREGDSRFWRLPDIERISQPGRYHFQIVSQVPRAGGPTESYNFQLLEDLPRGVIDYLWVRLHPSPYYP